jgi:hypothetical protein
MIRVSAVDRAMLASDRSTESSIGATDAKPEQDLTESSAV